MSLTRGNVCPRVQRGAANFFCVITEVHLRPLSRKPNHVTDCQKNPVADHQRVSIEHLYRQGWAREKNTRKEAQPNSPDFSMKGHM